MKFSSDIIQVLLNNYNFFQNSDLLNSVLKSQSKSAQKLSIQTSFLIIILRTLILFYLNEIL